LLQQKIHIQKSNNTAAVYNMIANLFWTAIFLLPISVYCYHFISLTTIYLLAGCCLVPMFLPNAVLDKIQLSNNASFYKKLGVKYVNAVAQNGSFINNMLKKKYGDFKVVSPAKASIKRHYYQTYFFEKFHLSLFLFFTSVIVFACVH